MADIETTTGVISANTVRRFIGYSIAIKPIPDVQGTRWTILINNDQKMTGSSLSYRSDLSPLGLALGASQFLQHSVLFLEAWP